MRLKPKVFLPFVIGLSVALLLFTLLKWWGFLVIFPWIGLSITTGMIIRAVSKGKQKLIGRKVAILMVMPCLLFFVPIVNNENFQLEGVALIVMVGFFSKGFIHYAIAKIFGPLIWRRGFCGWACWTAAVLDWLPVREINKPIHKSYKNIRFISLAISIALPLYLVFALSYNPYQNYINQKEMIWMFISNGVYYAIGIPLAFILHDKRAFCKYACPVSLIMKPSSSIGIIKIKPNKENRCSSCKLCNEYCPMGIDVMHYMANNKAITSTECILCGNCRIVCPENKII